MATRDALMVVVTCSFLVAAGCRPGDFDDLEDRAPIRVYEAPDEFVGSRYGRVVAAFSGELPDGTPVSRVMASGGPETSFEVVPVWTGGLDLGGSVFQGCERGECADVSGEGTALAGIPVFTSPSNLMEQRMCVLVPNPPTDPPRLLCETRQDTFETIPTGLTSAGLGEAVVGLGADDPVGFALFGAPRLAMGRGGVFLLRSDGDEASVMPADELDLSAANPSTTAELGADLAVARDEGTGRTRVAVAAPGMRRVVLAELAPDGMGGTDTTVLGCFDAPTGGPGGFASTVGLGDVNGDGTPDLAVGADTGGTPQPVHLYSGAGVSGAAGCAAADASDDPPLLATVACQGALDGLRDVDCTESAFGIRVAFGDLDADGRDELLVGAPLATVEGVTEAGAVYVVPFDSTDNPALDRADALIHSSPEDGDELGAALTTVETNLGGAVRDEVVAGMPGTDAIGIFLCSSLDGDTPGVGTRCIPD